MKFNILLISWLSGWCTHCFLVCICKLVEIGQNLHLQEIIRNKLVSELHTVVIVIMVWNTWHLSELCFILWWIRETQKNPSVPNWTSNPSTSGYFFWCSATWQLSYLISGNPSALSLFSGQNSSNLMSFVRSLYSCHPPHVTFGNFMLLLFCQEKCILAFSGFIIFLIIHARSAVLHKTLPLMAT